jgi:hypothetical protein
MTVKLWILFAVAIAGWMNRQQQEVIQYLREENHVLREKIGGTLVGKLAFLSHDWADSRPPPQSSSRPIARRLGRCTAVAADAEPCEGGHRQIPSP